MATSPPTPSYTTSTPWFRGVRRFTSSLKRRTEEEADEDDADEDAKEELDAKEGVLAASAELEVALSALFLLLLLLLLPPPLSLLLE
jgi:hypothetical protein